MGKARGKITEGDGWTLVRPCPECGLPAPECRCGAPAAAGSAAVVRLRLERRRGKAVTVLSASGIDPRSLADLLRELRAACAAGGTVKGAEAELQGDHREKVRALLRGRGIAVKG